MDALSDALRSLRVSGSMFFDADLKAPWAVVTPSSRDIASALGNEKDRVIPYHLVTEGECLVTVEGASTQLAAGDMALFPQGHVHVMASHAGVAPLAMTKEFVQGVLAQELLAAMARSSIDPKVAGEPGSDALVCKLSEILFIDALRQFVSRDSVPARGWLAGLRDPAIGRALAQLHSPPLHDWDIQALASACAFSRSKFVASFTRLVGLSPMKYLAQWRMILAARDLSDGVMSVKQIAERYRYGSEAASTKAFRLRSQSKPSAAHGSAR